MGCRVGANPRIVERKWTELLQSLGVASEPIRVPSLLSRIELLGLGQFRLPPDLPLVMADRRRVVQVLNNLLSNAVRQSPDSTLIRVSAVHQGLHVAVSVSDRGRGIAADLLPRLFRKFSRSAGDEREDAGLGLAILQGDSGRPTAVASGRRVMAPIRAPVSRSPCWWRRMPPKVAAAGRARRALHWWECLGSARGFWCLGAALTATARGAMG